MIDILYVVYTVLEVTQVRYGPTYRDSENIHNNNWNIPVKQKDRLMDTSKTSARRNPIGIIPLLYSGVTI